MWVSDPSPLYECTDNFQVSTSMYLIDSYAALTAASAIAANGLLRYVLGGTFPLFTIQSKSNSMNHRQVLTEKCTNKWALVGLPVSWAFCHWPWCLFLGLCIILAQGSVVRAILRRRSRRRYCISISKSRRWMVGWIGEFLGFMWLILVHYIYLSAVFLSCIIIRIAFYSNNGSYLFGLYPYSLANVHFEFRSMIFSQHG